MSAGERLYARLLQLLPRHLRDDSADMLLTFRDRHRQAVRERRTLRFVAREVFVLLRVTASERVPARRSGTAAQRATSGGRLLEHTGRELRHATRRLARAPGFTAAAVLTLSVAVAANVTIFTLVQRVVLAPLTFPESQRLVQLEHAAPGAGIDMMPGISTGLYREYATVPAIESMGVYLPAESTIDLGGDPHSRSPTGGRRC
jgi:hypothetical protein